VEQKEGATDRRQRLLFVTPKGEALAVRLAGLQSARIGRAHHHTDCLLYRLRFSQVGLVDALNRPGGNVTGVARLVGGLGPETFVTQ
jgi:hypothetical protein